MFSMIPSTGMLTFSNMATPRRASMSARSCGVETITAPASGALCAIVSWTSPVPGGMSTIRQSRSPQATSRSSWVIADITIGPRQTTGASSSIIKPIEITFTPWATGGIRKLRSTFGFSVRPNRRGAEGPNTSASSSPTRQPSSAIATARLAATVDLPTPPLPEATATIWRTPATLSGARRGAARPAGACEWPAAGGAPGARSEVRVTIAALTPSTPRSAVSAALRIGSARAACAGSTTIDR